MARVHRPETEDAVCAVVIGAVARGERLAIRGGDSKAAIGRPTSGADVLDLSGLTGVIAYDPPELVLTVGAGTPLAEVQALVAGEGQMLAFDPFDHGSLFGEVAGRATIGGVVAAGVAGPQRLSAGGARDHLLGFAAVSGRGERFVAGGKVVKNVTGYDLPKLLAGSWGRLAALTELTLKVLPRPRTVATIRVRGLSPAGAVWAMAQAMGSPADVAAGAHMPDAETGPATMLRVHGFPDSVDARCAMLCDRLRDAGQIDRLDETASLTLWSEIAIAAPLPPGPPLWRIVLPPRQAPMIVAALDGPWLMDWAGGLVWTATDMAPEGIRAAAAAAGGHAALIRADPAVRAAVAAFHPQPLGVAALEERVRRAFDPAGVFKTGRF